MDDLIIHAVNAWGYLIPRNSTITFVDFAAAIRLHSTHERAEIIAATLDTTNGFVTRDWRGFSVHWERMAS